MPPKPDNTKSDKDAVKDAEPLRISQVAQAAGVTKQTIEYYILLGLINPPRNEKTRRRLFTQEHIKLVKIIHQMNQTGYTLQEIRDIWLHPPRPLRPLRGG